MEREYDVPLDQAQIIWEPIDNPELPSADVVRLGHDDDGRYYSSWGACNQDFAEASAQEKVNKLMRQFVHMVAIDGANADDVHKAFMLIPEYRQALADFGSLDPEKI